MEELEHADQALKSGTSAAATSADRRRLIGRTNVEVTQMAFGGAPVGELFSQIDYAQARLALQTAWDAGIRYFDTSPWYGRGLSERRVGDFLRETGADGVLSTKVGRVLRRPANPAQFDTGFWAGGLRFDHVFDYTYDGIMRSFEDSLQRLGRPNVDLLVIHDLDIWHHRTEAVLSRYFAQFEAGGWRALSELRDQGVIRAIGVGINEVGLLGRFLNRFDLDFALIAIVYTLLEQDVLDELERCLRSGVGVLIGSPFKSGILATGARRGAKYDYADASAEIMERVSRIEAVCGRHDVPLSAAALQFPLGHQAVASVIVGMASADEVERNVAAFAHPIPGELWAELKAEGLIRPDAPTPAS